VTPSEYDRLLDSANLHVLKIESDQRRMVTSKEEWLNYEEREGHEDMKKFDAEIAPFLTFVVVRESARRATWSIRCAAGI
jgi:hypothetical protein